MPAVTITLGKRSFQMGCAAGEEVRLLDIAKRVNEKLEDLEGQVGTTNETVLLAMTCLMLQDELEDVKKQAGAAAIDPEALAFKHTDDDMAQALNAVSDYVETITKRIELV